MIQPLRQNFSLQALKVLLFILATLFVLIIWGALTGAQAQNKRLSNQTSAQATGEPLYRDYKGVRIGMTADDVRAKLRSSIKRLLVKYKYPPDKQPEAVRLVIEQMEAMAVHYVAPDRSA